MNVSDGGIILMLIQLLILSTVITDDVSYNCIVKILFCKQSSHLLFVYLLLLLDIPRCTSQFIFHCQAHHFTWKMDLQNPPWATIWKYSASQHIIPTKNWLAIHFVGKILIIKKRISHSICVRALKVGLFISLLWRTTIFFYWKYLVFEKANLNSRALV